jgi:ankyrin repeat protein
MVELANKQLLEACQKGIKKDALEAIQHGANINCKDEWGYNGGPLNHAVCGSHNGILELLLDNGADAKKYGGGPLLEAIKYGNLEGVKLLLKAKAPLILHGESATKKAAMHGNTEIMQELLTHGGDIHKNNEPFLSACWHKENKMVQFLIDQNVDIENLKDTALFEACDTSSDAKKENRKRTINIILSFFTSPELKELLKEEIDPIMKEERNKVIRAELNKREFKRKIQHDLEKDISIV